MTTRIRRDARGNVYWGNARFIWTEDDGVHFDQIVYARARNISMEQAGAEIRELAGELAPRAKIVTIDN